VERFYCSRCRITTGWWWVPVQETAGSRSQWKLVVASTAKTSFMMTTWPYLTPFMDLMCSSETEKYNLFGKKEWFSPNTFPDATKDSYGSQWLLNMGFGVKSTALATELLYKIQLKMWLIVTLLGLRITHKSIIQYKPIPRQCSCSVN